MKDSVFKKLRSMEKLNYKIKFKQKRKPDRIRETMTMRSETNIKHIHEQR
jgi:hypothetical protein